MNPASALRTALDAPGAIIAPGVYDALTALLVEQAGFPCAYVSGAITMTSTGPQTNGCSDGHGVDLYGMGSAPLTLRLEQTDVRLEMMQATEGAIDVETTTGTVTIRIWEAETDYPVHLDLVSETGTVTLDGVTDDDSASLSIRVHTVSGNIVVERYI